MRVAPAGDRRTWENVDRPTLRALEDRARATLGTPWPTPLAHDFARVFRDGDRDTYEQAIWGRHERLDRAVALAAATLDPVWIDEVADGVILFCEQSTWCWPAHDDTLARHGSVLPTVTDPCLDLGAGEVAAELAHIDHVLGARLDERYPGLRDRIRYEVERRVFEPFRNRRDWQWLGLDGDVNNWNPWIHCNVLVAASALLDDPAEITALAAEGIALYEAAVPPDGAIDEGHHYWWFGALRYLEAMELLGKPLDRSLIAFPHRVHLGGPWYVNHADGPARPSPLLPWHALHRLARLVGDPEAEAHAAAQRRPGEPVAHESQRLGHLLQALTDSDWNALTPAASPLPRDVWFPSTQVLLARQRSGTADGLTLVVKGGHNGENHNHNDIGSVIVARDGVPVLIDPGRPTYTAQTFGPDRYDIWTMQSAWHNTPTIRGTQQAAGRSFAARAVIVDDGSVSMDIAGAYPRGDIRSWVRTARLDRSTGTVTIRDSWELLPGDGTVVIHYLVAGDPEPGLLPDALPYSLVVKELDDPMLSGVWGARLTRIDIDVTSLGPVGTFELSIEENR
ncbi:MAG TPA: heparinase II/III family protein [Actinoplanes sp.]|nr:heparinase II/III family protein [Actinoplanes sp.]